MKRVTSFTIMMLLAVIAVLISGCGGNSTVKKPALSGTVTDVAGNLIPGAQISLDGRVVTKSLMNGSYSISNISSGSHNIEATATIDGQEWVGTKGVDVYSDGPTMNSNIIMGKYADLGDLEGAVTDASNHAIPNARVFAVARYPEDKPNNEASVVSKYAITDRQGKYTIHNLPGTIVVNGQSVKITYDVIASSVGQSGQPRGFENTTHTAQIAGNMVTTLNFTLQPSDVLVPAVPTGWTSADAIYVLSYTVPSAITSRSTESAYDAVKSCISERSRKAIALKRLKGHRTAPSGTFIENDVVWYSIWNDYFSSIPTNLAGFSIYRGPVNGLAQASRFRLDFVRDPSITSYADTGGDLTPGNSYSYAVSALSTSYLDENNQFNPDAESEMSYPATVTPIGKLSASSPSSSSNVSADNPVFTWQPVSGARCYKVYVYDSYPVVDALFTPQGDPQRPDHLPGWGESDTVTGTSVTFDDSDFTLTPGHVYWWVVMAADNSDFDYANAYSISELRSFTAR